MTDLRLDEMGEPPDALGRDEVARTVVARERFLAGVIGSLDSLVTVDEAWHVTFANPAASELFGSPEQDLLGRDFRSLLQERLSGTATTSLESAMSAAGVSEAELADAGGEDRYRCTAYPLADGGLALHLRKVPELERAGGALARGGGHYRNLVQGINSAILRWDVHGAITFANAYAEQLFGWRDDGLAGRPVKVLLPPAASSASGLAALDRQVLVDPDTHATGVRENVCRDGTRVWVTWTHKALRDHLGRVREVISVGNDVTNLVGSSLGRPESEAQLRALVQTTDDGIMLEGVGGTITFVNRQMADMLGYQPKDLLGRTSRDFVFDGRQADALTPPARLNEWEIAAGECKFRRSDRSVLWTRWRAAPMFDAAGRHIGNLTIYVDITHHEPRQGALRESEARYRDLFESIGEGFALCELVRAVDGTVIDFRYRDANPAFERLLHAGRGELQGRLHSQVQHSDSDPLRWYVTAVARGWPERREMRWGAGLWVDVSVLPRGHDQFAVRVDDVTLRRAAEDALHESQQRLEIAAEAAALGIYDLDVHTGLLELDWRGRGLWGLEEHTELTYEMLLAGVHPDDQAVLQAAVDTAFSRDGGQTLSVSHRVVQPRDRSVRWVHTSGRALFEEGEAVRLVGTVEDITDRVRAQQALREQDIEKAGRDERSRLARDLHDSVTQALFASTLKAEALVSAPGAAPPQVVAAVEDVHRLNRGALAQMRSMLLELRGEPVVDVPLEQLLRSVVHATESRCSAHITLSISGEGTPPPDVHEAVYRISQEALTNAARHARAATVQIRLDLGASQTRLTIQDDGRGFDVASVEPGRYGLLSMRERARDSGGEFRVESGRSAGTMVDVVWPVPTASG